MLRIETLNRKRIKTIRGEKIVDLTDQTINFKNTPRIQRSILVSEDLAMRIDSISRIVYGNANNIDFLMKFNDYSNPFAIDEGDIFLVPDENDIREMFIDPRLDEEEDNVRNELLNPNKFNKKDKARLEYLKQKAKDAKTQSPSDDPTLTTVTSTDSTEEIEIKDGKIIFGGNVVSSLKDCPIPVSRASLKAKLLANKIFRGE